VTWIYVVDDDLQEWIDSREYQPSDGGMQKRFVQLQLTPKVRIDSALHAFVKG